MLIESTYGNREHPDENLIAELGAALNKVSARGGVAVIPVFAVGRAQAILYAISLLKERGDIPHGLPVFRQPYGRAHYRAIQKHPLAHRLDAQGTRDLENVATMVESTDQSKKLASRHGPMVILAASGMATGGRVLHHLAHYLPDHRNMVILTGYQAPGTRGATLASGSGVVRIHSKDIQIEAEVVQLQSSSAHADASQLIDWLQSMQQAPSQVYVVHGEPEASDALRQRIELKLGWRALVPEHGSTWPT